MEVDKDRKRPVVGVRIVYPHWHALDQNIVNIRDRSLLPHEMPGSFTSHTVFRRSPRIAWLFAQLQQSVGSFQ